MLFGPDISNYQKGIDLARVRAEGFDFVSAKATQGSSYRSPDYARQRDTAIAAGLIFYAYHYVDTSDPAAQARNFLATVGDRNIAVMLDWEKSSGDGAWLRKVLAAFGAAGARVGPVYAPKWYWQQVGSPNLAGLPPLVASSYPSTKSGYASDLYRNVTATRWAGYGGNNVAILQFTDRAQIAGMSIDCNAYPGTREQLISLLYGSVAPTPPPAPSNTPNPALMPVLAEGQTSALIWQLAGFMNDKYPLYSHIDRGAGPTCRLGPQCIAALTEFQKRSSIPTDPPFGVGKNTWAALFAAGFRPNI